MAGTKVDLFATKNLAELHDDTALAGQTPGNGQAAAPFQVELADLAAWVVNNSPLPMGGVGEVKNTIAVGSTATINIPAKSILSRIVIIAAAATTVDVGTTASGSDIADNAPINSTGNPVLVVNQYYSAAGTVNFSGHSQNIFEIYAFYETHA